MDDTSYGNQHYAAEEDNAFVYSFDMDDADDTAIPITRRDRRFGETRDLFFNMIGDRLYKIVGNVLVLGRAVSAQQQKQSSLLFGCTDYAYGGDLCEYFLAYC
ncbi:hypothetical protein EON63_00885 [archaeon]|nr:MAG: hypothetical protein EON63_00885 [archaeon]